MLLYIESADEKPSPETERKIRISDGYATLGMHREAWDVMESIKGTERIHSSVMVLNAYLLICRKYWNIALRICESGFIAYPHRHEFVAMKAYVLNYSGKTKKCSNLLLRVQGSESRAIVIYNLACLAARFGQVETAKKAILEATRLCRQLRKSSRTDPDLCRLKRKCR